MSELRQCIADGPLDFFFVCLSKLCECITDDKYLEETMEKLIEVSKCELGDKSVSDLLLEGREPYEAFLKLVGVKGITEEKTKKIIVRNIGAERKTLQL